MGEKSPSPRGRKDVRNSRKKPEARPKSSDSEDLDRYERQQSDRDSSPSPVKDIRRMRERSQEVKKEVSSAEKARNRSGAAERRRHDSSNSPPRGKDRKRQSSG